MPPGGLVTHVRSSLILSSVQSIRTLGKFESYQALLTDADRRAILETSASHWLAMPLAMTHYLACDGLGLTLAEQIAIGHEAGDRVQGSFLGLLLRGAKSVGVTPWIALSHMDRIWSRVFQGGGGAIVEKLGPKEATCRFVGLPIIDVPYLRNAFRGAFLAGMEPFCETAYVQEIASRRSAGSVFYRLSWV